MLFALKNIESEFSEQVVLSAEFLLDLGKVGIPKTIEKQLWLIEVQQTEELIFEVEVQMSGKKAKAYTCDCENFSLNKTCQHLVAGLLQLRKHFYLKELKKRTKDRPKSNAPKKLNISSVLNNVSHDELKEFIRAYARKDNRFSLAIKAKFANAVHLENSKDKYSQLLNSTLTAVRKPNGTINYSGVLQIKKVVNDVLDHVDDALALEHYKEVAAMLQAIFEKIIPVIRTTSPNEKIIAELIKNSLSSLKNLIQNKIPQELKNKLWEFCLNELNKSSYRKYEIQQPLYEIVFSLTNEAEKGNLLLEKIDGLLVDISERNSRIPLLLLKFSALEKFKPKALNDFIEQHLNESEILITAIEKTYDRGDFSKAKKLATKGLESQHAIIIKNELQEYLLKIAQQTGKKKEIIKLAKIRFFLTLEFKYFQILKETIDKNWNKELESIINELESTPYHPRKKIIFAKIYSSENKPQELFSYIKKIRSLELLQEYDEQLLEYSKQDVYILYEDLIISYLQSHIGRKASEKIRVILFHFKKIGAKKLVHRLFKEFKTEYKERHTLMER